MKHRSVNDIKRIIIHCSMSDFGDAETIDRWHKERGWDAIGYHFVICNGFKAKGAEYNTNLDGSVQGGRSLDKVGAHAKGHNSDSIGICLVGDRLFTARQIVSSLPNLIKDIEARLGRFLYIELHNQLDDHKYCPGFNEEILKLIEKGVRP